MRQRIPSHLLWALPGLAFKRWLILLVLGFVLFAFGLAILTNLQPVTFSIEVLKYLARHIPSSLSAPLLIAMGLLAILVASRRMSAAMSAMTGDTTWLQSAIESLYRNYKLQRGPRIVAIGGGTGLSTLLRGLKHYTSNITAIVTVGDDGGSSGRLREEQGIIPPGDLRNCIAALADEERLITSLFQYRFNQGEGLSGHSFGNLFLTALCQVTGDMLLAIKESSKVLNIRGQVLPSTLEHIHLVAQLADGQVVQGESKIPEAQQAITHLACRPAQVEPLPEALSAIKEADFIVLGPGSLYTSVIPNLLIEKLASAIAASSAPKVYVCNMVTQPGETNGYSVGDHVKAILKHVDHRRVVDTVLVHGAPIPEALMEKYRQAGAEEVALDEAELEALGVTVLSKPLLNHHCKDSIRHDSMKLARVLMVWFRRRHIKRLRKSL
jgi:uncharacterized cofD-like protein